MKIVINAYSARQGGGQTYLLNLLSHLPASDTLLIEVFAPMRLKLPEHAKIKRVHTLWPTANPLMRAAWERLALPRYLKQTGADVLFCPGGLVTTKPPKGCKVVTMFRNMTPFDPIAMKAVPLGLQWARLRLLRRLMLTSMREADLTIFISEYARQVIETLAHIPNPLTIPHGISEVFRLGTAPLPRPAAAGDQPYLLYVSKLGTYKHHHEVVKAFSMLPTRVRNAHRLLLIGEAEGESAQRLHTHIRQLGVHEHVRVLGAVPYKDLPAYYQNAVANVFASSCENCPNIMLEALASGRPLLASDVEPMPEFGGRHIGYFSPFNPLSIERAMRKVLEDPNTAQSWAEGARQQGSLYSWAKTARDTWRAILNIKNNAG
ncbi:glycosyltransferase family 4 protein [Limnobacter sp.]|uniref:glycosyltransferase family 4 protein n=1 Tax=Limnobacter sp. TaxID=2003368 RepID=UPI00351712EE